MLIFNILIRELEPKVAVEKSALPLKWFKPFKPFKWLKPSSPFPDPKTTSRIAHISIPQIYFTLSGTVATDNSILLFCRLHNHTVHNCNRKMFNVCYHMAGPYFSVAFDLG